jgi:PEP-CTERM motif-containing protein
MTSRTRRTKDLLLCVLVLGLVMVSGTSQADTIYFSGEASDDDVPVGVFDARLEYTFDATLSQLTISLFNETVAPWDYTLSELMFNTTDYVSSMVLDSTHIEDGVGTTVGTFPLATLSGGSGQGGFGAFDWCLDIAQGNDGVLAGYSGHFVISVTPDDGSLNIADFFSHVSLRGETETGVAVLHFARGGEDDEDSAWTIPGDTPIVPEPASMVLLGMGLIGAAARTYRRRS